MHSNEIIWIEWFKPSHAEDVEKTFIDSLDLLRRSELLHRALKDWLKEAIANDSSEVINKDTLAQEQSKWWEKQFKAPSAENEEDRLIYLERKFLTPQLLEKKISVDLACLEWAKKTWSSSLSQLFIDQKDYFDEVTFKMMRLPKDDKHLANEIYHRIKASEKSFDELAMSYGHGPERLPGGCRNQLRLNSPQPQLAERLKRLNPGELTTPFQLAEWLLIIEMVNTKPATLDEEISNILIDWALRKFLKFGSQRLAEGLCNGALSAGSSLQMVQE